MLIYTGKTGSSGVAVGRLSLWQKRDGSVRRRALTPSQVPKEVDSLSRAVRETVSHLAKLYEKAVSQGEEIQAAVFNIHRQILEDSSFMEAVKKRIRTQMVDAAYAVSLTAEQHTRMFSSMENAYMRERASDVQEAAARLIRILEGNRNCGKAHTILIAPDLTPGETVQLDRDGLLGFVTAKGSARSHAAVLARSMGLPAVVQCDIPLTGELDGQLAALDGSAGKIYVQPTPEILSRIREKQLAQEEDTKLLESLRGKENRTLDGRSVKVYADISSPEDVGAALKSDAGGVGLFRTEFLCSQGKEPPSEEEQLRVYRTAAERLGGKELMIRTLDMDSPQPEEDLRTQLRGVYRAGLYGNVGLIYPRITSLDILLEVRTTAALVQKELWGKGIPVPDILQGVMIASPASVMMSRELSGASDFFVIDIDALARHILPDGETDPMGARHPAVLRMIGITAENARCAGIEIIACGEMDADFAVKLLRMGVDGFSVPPSAVLPLRQAIRKTRIT